MNESMKVVVWGPGGLGMLCIREISLLKELKLVGVRAYSAGKNCVDAGELAGVPPLGVAALSNAADVLAIDCDAILYTARDLAIFNNDEEIIQLLEAGKNVVTALPYHYMRVTRPPEYVDRMEAACKKSLSAFHATGVNPDLIGERVLLALTGRAVTPESLPPGVDDRGSSVDSHRNRHKIRLRDGRTLHCAGRHSDRVWL